MLDSTQIQQIKENLLLGKIKLLYVTPERLNNTDFLQTLDKIKISFFAIDEAHCIPQWGTSFRPEYKNLGNLKHRYPQIPQIVLATITNPKTISNTIKYLQLKKYNTFITPFNRKNIYYSVKIKKNEKEQLLSFIKEKHQNHSGIIYCISQKRAEIFATFLRENGYKAYPYHSSLNKTQKEQNQQIFAQQKKYNYGYNAGFWYGNRQT